MFRCVFTLALLILILSGTLAQASSKYEERLNELAEGVIAEAAKIKATRLAVLDFADPDGETTAVGQFLAEELGTQLLVMGDLTVVDRKLLRATMRKHRLTQLDVTQGQAIRRVAKALRADLFVIGSFMEIPEGLQVTAKLIRPKTVQATGAARSVLPKSGPLAALFKRPPAPTAPPEPPEPEEPAVPLPAHTNDLYAMTVTGTTRHGQHIGLEMTLENRTAHGIKIHCQLQDTYVKDDRGAEWRQNVSESRDGLCVRGMELSPGKKAQVLLSFPIRDRVPGSTLSLHFHETSPRRDAVFAINGLKLQDPGPPSNAEREATPAAP